MKIVVLLVLSLSFATHCDDVLISGSADRSIRIVSGRLLGGVLFFFFVPFNSFIERIESLYRVIFIVFCQWDCSTVADTARAVRAAKNDANNDSAIVAAAGEVSNSCSTMCFLFLNQYISFCSSLHILSVGRR